MSALDWENSLDILSSIPASSINACADQGLEALRLLHGNILSGVSGSDLIWERAAELNLKAGHRTSANGSCRLIGTGGAWIALNLAREEDWTLLNAWLESEKDLTNWSAIEASLTGRDASALVERGRIMGLPVALLPRFEQSTGQDKWLNFTPDSGSPKPFAAKIGAERSLNVVDLSALWAGPLCAHLLHQCGMQVTTVTSTGRPDGSRVGNPKLYEILHRGHLHRAFDFNRKTDLARLAELIQRADIVIEGSRPRALRALGLDKDTLMSKRSQVWLSITAYGRVEPYGDWVGFGDDVAVAAGLVQTKEDGRPDFLGDALADPLTGIFAALAVATLLDRGWSGLVDLSLWGIAKHCRRKIQCAGESLFNQYHRPKLRC